MSSVTSPHLTSPQHPEVVVARSESVVVGGGSGGGGGGSADWTCGDSECRHLNFARRTQCNKCERQRSPERADSVGAGSSGSSSQSKKKLGTEIGKAAAEKSRGLFSAEDWQCSKCANVNWARRLTCNMCNAPKFSDVEERTGYGGGYNDRGVVEYKERAESDSEYDEFGRLKKRKATDSYHKDGKHRRAHASDNEEGDDDSDEDGDGDLSKYDLWGDDEVAPATTVAVKASKDIQAASKSSPNRTKAPTKTKSSTATKTLSRSRSRSRGSESSSSNTSTSSGSSTSSSTPSTSRSSHSHSSSARSRSRSRSHHRQKSSLSKDRNLRPTPTSLQSTKDRIRSRSRSRECFKTSSHYGRRR